MRTVKVKVENFQSLQEASLEFTPGVTVVTGPNNSGKTALFRAIRAFYFNLASASQVRAGSDGMTIRVSHTDGEEVHKGSLLRSAKGASRYIVDSNEYVKVGRDPLPEVAEHFRVKEVQIPSADFSLFPNFWSQEESPFIIDLTPAKAYDFFSQEKPLLETLTDLKDQTKESATKVKHHESRITALVPLKVEQQAVVEEISAHQPHVEDVLGLHEGYSRLQELNKTVERLSSLSSVAPSLIANLSQTQEALSVPLPEEKLFELSKKVEVLIGVNSRLQKATANQQILEHLLSHALPDSNFEKLAELTTRLDLVSSSIVKLNSNSSKLGKLLESVEKMQLKKSRNRVVNLTALLSGAEFTQQQLTSINEKLHNLEKTDILVAQEYAKFTVCPLCGNNKEHLNECE